MPPTIAAASITKSGLAAFMNSKVAFRSSRSTTLRLIPITLWPRPISARVIAEPTKPVEPAITIVMK